MIARWCISTLIFSLTVFGVISQQQIAVPNQEIVLQFTDVELTSDGAKNTIAIVKNQLLELGGENIKIRAQQNGKIRISYFSDFDVSSIKSHLAKTNDVVLDYNSSNHDENSNKFPSNNSAISYKLDVHEIQKNGGLGWDLDGSFVSDVEVKSDRFLDPNLCFSASDLDFRVTNKIVKVAYKVYRSIAIEIGEPLHSKPEVRAGPLC